MKIGVVFPRVEIGQDAGAIKEYAQAVEALGYSHIPRLRSRGGRESRASRRLEGPVQRPIPIWMGGESEVVLRRTARLADGWMPHFRPGPQAQAIVDRLQASIREVGRDPAHFGIEGRFTPSQVPAANWANEIARWRDMRGITHLCVNTMGLGLKTPADHVHMLERFTKDALG